MEKKPILFYNRAKGIGGHEVLSLYAIEQMSKMETYDIHVIISKENTEMENHLNKMNGISIHKIAGISTKYQIVKNFLDVVLYNELVNLIRETSPLYIIALQGNIEISNEIVYPAKKCGVKTITYIPLTYWMKDVSRHRKIGYVKDWIDRRLYNKIDFFITINEQMKTYISERGKDKQDIYVVENGVDYSKFQEIDVVQEKRCLGIEDKKHVYGIVGRIEFLHKGQNVIVEVVNKYREEFEDTVFLIAGGGSDKDRLIQLIREYGLDSLFMILGNVEKPERIYSVVDTLVVPSWFEGGKGTPLVIYEAMYHLCNVCGNDIPGMREVLGESYLFENDNLSSIKDVLLKLKEQKNYRQISRDVLEERHSINSFWKQFKATVEAIEKRL